MPHPAAAMETPNPEETPVFPLWNQALVAAGLTIVALLAITGIRTLALRVTQYQVSVYEDYVRDAMAKGDFARAVEICTGAIRASVNTSAHWGRAWALRAEAHRQAGELPEALADLHSSHTFFQQRYYQAKDADRAQLAGVGTEVGKALLSRNDPASALTAFSVAAAESGRPVEYLQKLQDSLSEPARTMLWPDGAVRVVLRDFTEASGDSGMTAVVEQQGRQVQASGIDSAQQPPAAVIGLSPGTKEGRSAYAAAVWMPIMEGPYAIRLVAKANGPMPQALLNFWFDSARESASISSTEWVPQADGWQTCTIASGFQERVKAQAEQRGFAPHDGILNRAGFEFTPESANQAWLARVELVMQ